MGKGEPTYQELEDKVQELQALLNKVQGEKVKEQLSQIRKVDEAVFQNNPYLNNLNQIALEFTNLSSNDNLGAFIATKVKGIANAKVALFSEYDAANKTIIPKYIDIEPGLLKKVVDMLGMKIENIHAEVSEETYKELTYKMITVKKTLHEASFESIPFPIAAAIQTLLKVDRFIGIAYLLDGKLYGTSLVGMDKDQPNPPKEIVENFIHLASSSLRRKNAERVLKESEEKYRKIVNKSTDVVWTQDLSFNTTYMSQSIERILGYTVDEYLSLPVEKRLPKVSMPIVARNLKENLQKIKNGEVEVETHTFIFEMLHKHKNGKLIWGEVSCSFLYDDDKNITGIHGITRDVSSRKEAELIIKEQNEELIKLNEDKDKFMSILAHDLKNPFNALLGLSRLLLENIRKYDISTIEKQVSVMNYTANKTYNLLEDILLWSKAQSGKIVFQPEKINLWELCQSIKEENNNRTRSKDIALQINISRKLNVFTDANLLKTVMRNLISNAIKFTPKGGTIEVDAKEAENDIMVSVSDTGVGIAEDILPELFNIAKEYMTKGTDKEEGTGLGLQICKEFVGKMGGEIWVESELGKGSIFKFSLQSKK